MLHAGYTRIRRKEGEDAHPAATSILFLCQLFPDNATILRELAEVPVSSRFGISSPPNTCAKSRKSEIKWLSNFRDMQRKGTIYDAY